MATEGDYKVKNIALGDFGRKDIRLSEVEMPGLIACRSKFADLPLKGAKVAGSLHMTIQTAVLIETLVAIGADVRWCSCNIFSTQDHAAAAIAASGTPVFAWKGETLDEYWECTLRAVRWPDGTGPDIIVDDGGDMTLLIHKGVEAEAKYAESGGKVFPDPASTDDAELKIVYKILARELPKDPKCWTKMAAICQGVSEETTTGVHRLQFMADKGELFFPAININDCVTKSKFDNLYGCKHSLPDGLMRATDVMLAGKKTLVAGYGDVGKGCAQALKAAGCIVYVSEIDPICALQACMEGFQVKKMSNIIGEIDIFITATGNKGIIMLDDMKKMKNNAIVGNIGHFDNEIDMAGLEGSDAKCENIKPHVVDRWLFPDGHGVLVLAEGRLLNLGCATGHPSFVMSCSFTNQVLAQIELWTNRKEKAGKYMRGKLYNMPKNLDEMVARLHLSHLGAELTALTPEQSKYLHIPVEGPYKPETYRY